MVTKTAEVGIRNMDLRKESGRSGEDFAAAFFISQGFRVIDQNWSCRMGEIDLIVEKDKVVHFIEVKTRKTRTYGYPEEAITRTKLLHLRRAIEMWLRAQSRPPTDYQADALAILALDGCDPEIKWIEHIL